MTDISGGAELSLAAALEARLRARFTPSYLHLEDDSAAHAGHAGAGGGSHFSVTIVAEAFKGQTRVARHRLVYDALADAMRTHVHALAIAAHTPEEYDASF